MKTVDKYFIIFIVCFMFGFIGIWVFQATVEARVYNRETTSSVTTWEAMWVNLRVDCK